MAISYNKMFHKMIDENISNAELAKRAGISLNIITRLKKNEYISLESVEKICTALGCSVDDILDFVDESKQ